MDPDHRSAGENAGDDSEAPGPSLGRPRTPGAVIAPGTLFYWSSRGFDDLSPDHAITIPTFKRPGQLVETIRSVAPQAAQMNAVVVVMENEAEHREGAKAAALEMEAAGVAGLVIVAVEPGNCNAYNAGWQAVLTLLPSVKSVAVCDDDETAEPGWLSRLIAVMAETGAEIVGGPQRPRMPDGHSGPVHPVFKPPYAASGSVPILYSSGNALIARAVFERLSFPWLDPVFNYTGGGDADFYVRARAAGFRFAWAHDAVLNEFIPERRLETDWLRARSLRNGALSAMIEKRARPGLAGRLSVFAKSAALLAASPLRAAIDLLGGKSRADARYRIDIGIGRMMGELGWINEQYRAPEKN